MEARVSASQGAIRSLPWKLESLLSGSKHNLRPEEKKKLCILQGDLQGLIDNYLLEPSEVESPASTANFWMKDVRDLSYDIDDFLNELAQAGTSGARISIVQIQKPTRVKISRFPEKLKRRQWITDEILGFRTRVNEAIQRHKSYLSDCKWLPSSRSLLGEGQHPAPSSCAQAAIHLVGVDSSIKQLCGWLANDGQPEHKVVSIVGAGGVGKTTLANEVYRKLGGQFECQAFVRTSRKPDMKRLLTSILSQVRRHQLPGSFEVHGMVLEINKHLQDKTYIIVIDDLWASSTWDIVNLGLPKGNCCSRILITTEIDAIAQTCYSDTSNSKYIFRKEPLSEGESRELVSTVFGFQAECPQGLKEVSNEIIKRSGGLPLTINILASLLARQPASSIEQWNYIKNALSSDLSTNASLEEVKQVLNLGYDNLPHSLKACMLYLCLYEEDCVIWKDDLVKQWIAEGFVCTTEGNDGKEVAQSYFDELINRRIIEPVDINCNDEILSCRVHHIILYFIRYKSIEENFSIVIDYSQTAMRLADKVRRLALHFSSVEDATPPALASMRLSQVRSLAFSGLLKCMPSIVEFRFLQVLILKLWADPDNRSDILTGSDDLSGSITEADDLSDNLTEPDDLSYNLTEIAKLFLLRYFHLDACYMNVELPTHMQRLKDLMAFEIDAKITAVPSDIVDLPGLLYLSIPSKARLPTGICRMTSLRTLGVIDLSNNSTETVMSLGGLTNLQDLRFTCSTLQPDILEKNLECLGSVIRKLRNLKCVTLVPAVSSHVNIQDDAGISSMTISWHGFNIEPLSPALIQRLELSRRCCIFSSLPQWTNDLTKLCILKIAVRKLSNEDVFILNGLPSLTALSLFVWTTPGRRIIFDNEGFLVLKYFKFVCAAPCMVFLDGAMPNVRKLKLGFNANRMERCSLAAAGFERLTRLIEISTKIGGASADECDRWSAQSVLTDAISKHPSTPIIIVQWLDWNFYGDDEKYTEVQNETWNQTSSDKQDVSPGESSDEHEIQEKYLEEDAMKQADIRTYMPPESTWQKNTEMESVLEKKLLHQSSTPKYMDIQYLRAITKNFSKDQILGSGGYGIVYKGEQENGEVVAVKKLTMSMAGMDDKQFMNEVRHVMDICHPNIVRLEGYCYQIEKELNFYNGHHIFVDEVYRLLCFEYLPNGSLDKYLSDESSGLDWHTRYSIIVGICTGLYYLHEGREGAPILHMDLKPTNILLDKSMTPKIAYFGLSRLFDEGKTHTFTRNVIGSRGYMAPEHIKRSVISKESDIFSLGVIIVEIVTGQRKYPEGASSEEFIEVCEKWRTRLQKTSNNTSLEEECRQVDQCIEVALKCMENDPKRRPSIREIVAILKRIEYSVGKDSSDGEGQSRKLIRLEWRETLDILVSGSSEQSVKALKVICDELNKWTYDKFCVLPETNMPEYIMEDADRLVSGLTLMVQRTFSSNIARSSSGQHISTLYTLLLTVQIKHLVHAVTKGTLEELVTELQIWLLVEETEQVLNALKEVMIGILKNADRTSVFVILINLLRPLAPSRWPSSTPLELLHAKIDSFLDAVVHHIYFLTEALESTINDLDLDLILQSIDAFLEELGLEEMWRGVANHYFPVTVLINLLKELVKLLGSNIKVHLSMVPIHAEHGSMVLRFIDQFLQESAAEATTSVPPTGQASHGGHAASSSTDPSTSLMIAKMPRPQDQEDTKQRCCSIQ